MKQAEIKDLSTKDLEGKIAENKLALLKLKMGHKVSPIENPLAIRHRCCTEQQNDEINCRCS